ncbi:zinc-dependent metalloprotease family protein [Dyadobacter sp. Leaf189]|uniref:zinc-dependent metalloprotease family protein n=1 Tax=Dyadobacter sp. Leaf189 TaxID=1736295 RepID=UPI0006F1F6D2|nr:zinc-dependent metalloprotease family protein [Dyadobacter sp. Leaf189]KQS30820.1 hypothetical protein ASG33_10610 [Dyadobacter sp. Leaf189]
MEKATASLAYGTKILQECNNIVNDEQDVACMVTVAPSGSMGTFGAADDQMDVINTQAELRKVMDDKSAFVKIVTAIMGSAKELVCGTTGSALACADTPGSSIIIVSGLSNETTGEVLMHEFGHSRGLPHRDSPGNPIMHTTKLGTNEVNADEAAMFHKDGADDGPNRPADIVFVVDDTGSMSEEIGGVRQGIITYLNKFASSATCTGTVFQLVTFKDDVTIRPPTSDLSVIIAQVSALFASGGSDCPEASVEALKAVDPLIKDGGSIILYTDADAHAGQSKESVVELYKILRKVSVSTLLSGTCSGASSVSVSKGESNPGDTFPPSDNKDGKPGVNLVNDLIAAESAIDTYSFIAQETGGIFVFFPDVNSGNPADTERFQNLVYNLIVGGVSSAVTLIAPSAAPVGSELTLTVTGTNTNFNSSSSVDFAGDDITTGTPTVISTTRIEIPVKISAGAVLGFKDVTITTTLNGGETETATGIGLFSVTPATLAPTITSITPPTGSVGQTLTVTVNGVNTNFNKSSVLNLGEDISIVSTTVLSAGELQADIQIAGNAVVGFRNVTVITDSEVATENVTGPFLVTTAGCAPVTVANVTIPSGSSATVKAVGCSGSLLWSTGETTESITLGPLKEDMVVSVTCTTGACEVTAIATITVKPVVETPLVFQAPTFDCTTGAFKFNITGGDGTTITYAAEGITVSSTDPNQFIDLDVLASPTAGPITLSATQSGVTITYIWNIREACPVEPPVGGALVLLAPIYDCKTGAFTFVTSGGDGTAISFAAVGITGWTTNPDQFVDFELRTAADAPSITLSAMQSGVTVAYVWSIRAVCPVEPPVGEALVLLAPAYDCKTGAFRFKTSGGNGTAISFSAIGISGWTTNADQFVDLELRTAPDAPLITLYAMQSGVTVSYVWNIREVCPLEPPVGDALVLLAPAYDCKTGAFRFKTSGGNGTAISFSAIGISGWTMNADQFVDLELRTAPDAPLITLYAMQSGITVTYVWNIREVCPLEPPVGDALVMLPPAYDCSTGAVRFKTMGGDGTSISFSAVGITGWTTNPDQYLDYELRTAADAPLITLNAVQSGVTVTYVWNVREVCPVTPINTRMGVAEPTTVTQISVLGNPVSGREIAVEVRGMKGKSLLLELRDVRGRVVEEKRVTLTGDVEKVQLRSRHSPALYLLQLSSEGLNKVLRIVTTE